MEKLIGKCNLKIQSCHRKNIANVIEFVECSTHLLGDKKFKIILPLLKKLREYELFKESLLITKKIFSEARQLIENQDDLIFFYGMHSIGNLYNFKYRDNEKFYNEYIKNSDFWDLKTKDSKNMFFNLSLSFKHLSNYKAAVQILEKSNQIRIQLAINYFLNNQIDKSIETYKTLLKNATPEDRVHINFNLYELYEKIDNKKSEKYIKKGEKDFLKLKTGKYIVTRSMILYKFYINKDRLTAYGYLKRAINYEPFGDMDIKNKIEAVKILFSEHKILIPDIDSIWDKYIKFTNGEFDDFIKEVKIE